LVNCDGAEAIGSMSVQDFRSALADFHQARRQAALQEIIAHLQGKSTELLSYEEVCRKLRAAGRAERGLLPSRLVESHRQASGCIARRAGLREPRSAPRHRHGSDKP